MYNASSVGVKLFQSCNSTSASWSRGGGGHSHIGSHQGCAARMGEFSRPKNLRMGHNSNTWETGHYFNNSTWEWVVFMKLNKTCFNLVNFSSCFIAHSLEMGLLLFIDKPTLVWGWVNFLIVWPHTPVQAKLKWPPGIVIIGTTQLLSVAETPVLTQTLKWNQVIYQLKFQFQQTLFPSLHNNYHTTKL